MIGNNISNGSGSTRASTLQVGNAPIRTTSNSSNKKPTQGNIDQGFFNFQNVMSQVYGSDPQDDAGKAMKNSFMYNMIQSGFDLNLAKDMAYTQSGIAKGNMLQAADLDLRNKTALMNDEFNKGFMSMGGQFEFQNRYAEDQNVRDITKDTTAAAVGYEFQNRYAENQNIRDINKGSIERADNYEYGNRYAENQTNRNVQEAAYKSGMNFTYSDKMKDNDNIRNMAYQGFLGDDNRKTIAQQGLQNRLSTITANEQGRYNMMQQGAENRETERNRANEARNTARVMGQETRLTDTNRIYATGYQNRLTDSNKAKEARKTYQFQDSVDAGRQTRQAARARNTARSF